MLFWGGAGGAGCLSTSRIRTSASAGHGEAPAVPDLPGGRGWTSVPRGHGASGGGAQGLEGSMSGARCPSDWRPGPTPSPGSILAHFQPPSFLPPGPSGALFPSGCVNHCLSAAFLSAPGARANMATWPPSEGSRQLELLQGLLGVVVPPPLGSAWRPGPDPRGRRGHCPLRFPGLRPLHGHTGLRRRGRRALPEPWPSLTSLLLGQIAFQSVFLEACCGYYWGEGGE